MIKSKKPNIAVIGGGTGVFAVLTALKDHPVELTAVVSMADDGGSSGILRDQYGVLPPGDIRKALVALAPESHTLRHLFNYRFDRGDFNGHSFGNIFLSALERVTGSFASSVGQAAKILNIKGRVVPVTLDNTRLYAELTDGAIVVGETNIDIPKVAARAAIKTVWLKPRARMNPEAGRALIAADFIIIGPGDLYTSVIPNLLVRGVPEAIKKSRAKKIYIANLMTKRGETDHLKATDFTAEVEKYVGRGVLDFAVFNNRRPALKVIKRYRKEGSEFIDPSDLDLRARKPKYVLADLLDSGSFARHDPRRKLAKVILSLVKEYAKKRKSSRLG